MSAKNETGSNPSSFAGRNVVIGVCGGIAAYKAIQVVRQLVDGGAHVAPILTESATRFVGEVTFTALASERVHTSLWEDESPIPHTRLGQNADVIVVAPATARLIGAYAAGISDDLLTATLVATRAPVVIAPAMHTEMWEHASIQENLATLARRGVIIVPPEEGRLAGGDVGAGRLASPDAIVAGVAQALGEGPMSGQHVVVTAGGTREPIDPVRFIGNRSTGKQGYAIANEAAAQGARVTLIATVDRPMTAGVERTMVNTAAEMRDAVMAVRDEADVIVMVAAVADFRPADVADRKLKKADGVPTISLERTDDILATLGADKRAGQILVGFAAETNDVIENAARKIKAKGADLLVANDVSADSVGFGHDTNAVTIVTAEGQSASVALSSKRDIAKAVLRAVAEARDATN